MKIQKNTNYKIDLLEEPCIEKDHQKNPAGTLIFTGQDLINAVVSVGMPDVYLKAAEKQKRKDQIEFKLKLFETFVTDSPNNLGYLSFDISRIEYLDSTELSAIDYWIGMILITVLGQKKYAYDYMVHLSMIGKFSKIINIQKKPTNNNRQYFPDLIAINTSQNKFGVFESKGYIKYSSTAMESGFNQAHAINKINGQLPVDKLVVMTNMNIHKKAKIIEMIIKDPEGGKYSIDFDLNISHIYHFLPITELIMELGAKEQGNRVFGSLEYGNDNYSISLPSNLYKKLSKIIINQKIPNLDDLLINETTKEILRVE